MFREFKTTGRMARRFITTLNFAQVPAPVRAVGMDAEPSPPGPGPVKAINQLKQPGPYDKPGLAVAKHLAARIVVMLFKTRAEALRNRAL